MENVPPRGRILRSLPFSVVSGLTDPAGDPLTSGIMERRAEARRLSFMVEALQIDEERGET